MSVSARAEIDIAAPIEVVWAVMLDLGAYAAWNPFIVEVEGAPARVEVGSRFRLHVKWAKGGKASSGEVVTRLVPPISTSAGEAGGVREAELRYRFTGALDALNLVRAERVQALTELPGGQTRYFTEEVFTGLLTVFLPIGDVRDGFDRHARALKQRAESLSRG